MTQIVNGWSTPHWNAANRKSTITKISNKKYNKNKIRNNKQTKKDKMNEVESYDKSRPILPPNHF